MTTTRVFLILDAFHVTHFSNGANFRWMNGAQLHEIFEAHQIIGGEIGYRVVLTGIKDSGDGGDIGTIVMGFDITDVNFVHVLEHHLYSRGEFFF